MFQPIIDDTATCLQWLVIALLGSLFIVLLGRVLRKSEQIRTVELRRIEFHSAWRIFIRLLYSGRKSVAIRCALAEVAPTYLAWKKADPLGWYDAILVRSVLYLSLAIVAVDFWKIVLFVLEWAKE